MSTFVPAVHKPVVVLDTNVCLDWLIFADPRTARLAMAVQSSRVDWIASPSMREEFRRVLSYKAIRHRVSSVAEVLGRYDSWSRTTSDAALTASHELVCEDPDDQTFVDLALEHRPTWLFSRDQMVCRLAPKAALLGVVIVTPDGFEFGGEA